MAAFRVEAGEGAGNRELIQRTLAGDGDAYAVLVDRFQRKVFRVAYAIVRDEGEADLVTQDTFIQAYTSLANFEGRAEFETWLTRIAINRARDSLRRRRFVSLFTRDESGDDVATVDPADERPDPERQAMSSQLQVAIERAVETLSSQQKIIFRLRHYENLSLEEIAEHLGLRAGTARVHLFRAVHKIRKELSAWRTRQIETPDDDQTLQ